MKKDRHTRIEVQCEWCNTPFFARAERVRDGLGKFCSKECFHEKQRKTAKDTIWGRKELATCYKIGERYCARWYDEEGKTKSTPYGKWWWEMNIGEIPFGYLVLHKDNNPLNIDPSNFELGTKSDVLVKGNKTRRDNPKLWEAYTSKLREKSTGRVPSVETRAKQATSAMNRSYTAHGDRHANWRGGIPKVYPKEFYEIRDFVISRDNSQCQICSKTLVKNQHVHHRDGCREHNDQDNLITFCASCHGKVHSQNSLASPPILAFRTELHWNR